MPNPFSGRSRTWPTVARTRYDGPRYLPIVRAFAGDSTMTSDLPATVARSSGSSDCPRRDVRRPGLLARDVRDAGSAAATAPLERRRVPNGFASVSFLSCFAPLRVFFIVFFAAMESVYGHVVAAEPVIHVARALHQDAQVVEGDSAVDLAQRPFDDMFELHRVEHTGAVHRYEMSPCIGRKAAPFMRSEHAKSHGSVTKSGTFPAADAGRSRQRFDGTVPKSREVNPIIFA